MRILKRRSKLKVFCLSHWKFLLPPLLVVVWGVTGYLLFVFAAFFLAESYALDVYLNWKQDAEELGRILDEMEKDDDI